MCFPYSRHVIETIEVVRRGVVRRAKLYYLRGLRGKRARIAEKIERRVGTSAVAKAAKVAVASDEVPPEAPVVETAVENAAAEETKQD